MKSRGIFRPPKSQNPEIPGVFLPPPPLSPRIPKSHNPEIPPYSHPCSTPQAVQGIKFAVLGAFWRHLGAFLAIVVLFFLLVIFDHIQSGLAILAFFDPFGAIFKVIYWSIYVPFSTIFHLFGLKVESCTASLWAGSARNFKLCSRPLAPKMKK